MIRKSYPWLLLVIGVGIGLVISGRLVLLAQDRAGARRSNPSQPPGSGQVKLTNWRLWNSAMALMTSSTEA